MTDYATLGEQIGRCKLATPQYKNTACASKSTPLISTPGTKLSTQVLPFLTTRKDHLYSRYTQRSMPSRAGRYVSAGPVQEPPRPGHRPVHVLEGPVHGTDFEAIPGLQSCCAIRYSEPDSHEDQPGIQDIEREDVIWFWHNILCSCQLNGQWIIPPTGHDWRMVIRFGRVQLDIRNNSAREVRFVDFEICILYARGFSV